MAVLNGRLPDSMLATIPGTNRQLALELVPQTAALREAFEAHFGKPLVITDAYRDYETQVELKREKGPYAATPGTSVHGWGHALDLGSGVNTSFTSPEHLWMRANGPRFGWNHPAWAHNHNPSDGEDEPWHFEGTTVSVPTASGHRPGTTPRPVPKPPIAPPIDIEEITLELKDTIRLLRAKSGEVVAYNTVTGALRGVTLAAFEHLAGLGIRDQMWFKSGNGNNLNQMDPPAFWEVVGLLGGVRP